MKITLNKNAAAALAWLVAVSLAIVLAIASPSDASTRGHLTAFGSQSLSIRPMETPGSFTAERTLALITFKRDHRDQAESWIRGLDLERDTSIAWMRMPVFDDPGTPTGRSVAERKLMLYYPAARERANMVPIFTDRADFVRAAGLPGIDRFYAVVVSRNGEVLARLEGQFDADKAQTLRETLQAHDL